MSRARAAQARNSSIATDDTPSRSGMSGISHRTIEPVLMSDC
jgi:hypothetical protein